MEYFYPNIGTIPGLELYLNGTKYADGTAIDWGECQAGFQYYFENMTVKNIGPSSLTVYVVTQGLPSTWLLEWQVNNTLVPAGSKIGGWLNLTIPTSAISWPTWGFYLRGA